MLQGHTQGVNSIRFSPDGRWIASAGEDGYLKLWDLTVGKLLNDFKGHSAAVSSVEFHPSEFLLASASLDRFVLMSAFEKLFMLTLFLDFRTVKYWDLETLKMIGSTDGQSPPIRYNKSLYFNMSFML